MYRRLYNLFNVLVIVFVGLKFGEKKMKYKMKSWEIDIKNRKCHYLNEIININDLYRLQR